MNPILSIIIPSYNTSDLTINCLKSIYQDKGLKDIPFEIIIVDNASSDDSVSQIKNYISTLKIKNLKLKINLVNLGFGKANNQAFKIARGNYLLLLNSDTIILHSAISQSLDWLSSHPEAYGCTAQLLNSDKSIQPSGGYFPSLSNIFTWSTGLDDLPLINKLVKPFHPHSPDFYTHDSYYLTDHQQDWITGAFALIRKNIIDKVGGFDENYFMYGEEMEMFYRIRQKFPKYQLWYLIGPQIIHLGGSSSKTRKEVFEREYDGISAFFKKHRPGSLPLINLFISINRILQSTVYTWLRT